MATDRLGRTVLEGDKYLAAGTVLVVDGDSVVIVLGDKGEHALRVKASDVVRVDDVLIDTADFTGSLAGLSIRTPQELAAHLDANWTPTPP